MLLGILFLVVMVQLIGLAIKASWGIFKVCLFLVFFPIIVLGLIFGGLIFVALLFLIIAGIGIAIGKGIGKPIPFYCVASFNKPPAMQGDNSCFSLQWKTSRVRITYGSPTKVKHRR